MIAVPIPVALVIGIFMAIYGGDVIGFIIGLMGGFVIVGWVIALIKIVPE